jgi:hypothetical protein
MKRMTSILVALSAAIALAPFSVAGPGHDHSHDHAAPTATGPALPRFAAQSDLFDAVGVLGKEELVIFIDRAATNEPVLNATVELESGSIKAVGKFEASLGEYHFDGKPFQQTNVYPIILTIKVGNDSDLLSADLDVHADGTHRASSGAHVHSWREYVVRIGAVLLVIASAVAALIVVRRKKSRLELRDRSAA